MSSTREIVAAEMWSVTSFEDPNARFEKFMQYRRSAIKSLIKNIVIHDKVFVPIDDCMSLSILLHIFGERAVLNLINQRALGFDRLKGALPIWHVNFGILAQEP